MRYSYALKKFPKDSYASEKKAFRELHYNLLLSLCRCKRKLGVSVYPFIILKLLLNNI